MAVGKGTGGIKKAVCGMAGFLDGAISAAKMDIFLFWGIFFLIMVVDAHIFSQMRVCIKVRIKKWHSINVRPVCRIAVLSVAVFGFLNSWQYLDECLGITQYLELRAGRTEIYEDYYVDPLSVEITFEEHPKNLIYIYIWKVWKTPMRRRLTGDVRR